jgi:hypothetical protein
VGQLGSLIAGIAWVTLRVYAERAARGNAVSDQPSRTSGFAAEDDRSDDQLEADPRFEKGIEAARQSLRAGHGIKLEDIDTEN